MAAKPVSNEHDASATGEDSLEQRVDDHLSRALEAESPDVENYHIRSAQQLLVVLEYEPE